MLAYFNENKPLFYASCNNFPTSPVLCVAQTSSEDSNRNGRANTNYPVIDTYTEGSIIEVKIVVSTSHVVSYSLL